MSKNSIIAFLLILATITIFTSPQYNKFFYEKILKQPYPVKTINEKKIEKDQQIQKEKKEESVKKKTEDEKREELKVATTDSINKNIKTDTVWIENSKIKVGIDEKGANIISIKMKEYKNSIDKEQIEIMDTLDDNGASISINGEDYSDKYFTLINTNEKKITVPKGEKKKLIFTTENDESSLTKEFEIGDDYKIGITIKKNNLSGKRIKIEWNSGLVESEKNELKNKMGGVVDIRKAHYYNGESVQHLQMEREETESSTGTLKWVGISSKYFLIAIVNDTINDADINIKGIIESPNKKNKNDINYQISYEKTADENESKFWIYAGPNSYDGLKKYNLKFEKVLFPVTSWARHILWADRWFPPIAEIVLNILLWLYGIVKDYGIAIIILTILSRLITYPLTQSSMKSMNRMKDLQPKVEALRKKHKNNPQKLNQEIMELYRAEGVNPLNPGCLPMFLQMPIFIALFVVLRKAIELRGATTVIMPWVSDLSKAEVVFRLPAPLPMYGDNFAIMPIIMAAITFYQNKITMKDPNQKALVYIMPIFMLVLFNSFPAGLVLYWTFSSGLALLQQIITEKMKKNKK